MIIFKYIPNILNPEGRIIKELPYVASKPLQDYLTETGFELNETRVIVMGAIAKDVTPILKNGDEVIVTPKIEGPVWAGVAVFWATYGTAITIGFTILSVAYTIYSMCTQPKTPNFGTTGDGLDEGSPTYAWDGIVNTQDVGVPIPVVYGKHPVGGNRIIKL